MVVEAEKNKVKKYIYVYIYIRLVNVPCMYYVFFVCICVHEYVGGIINMYEN